MTANKIEPGGAPRERGERRPAPSAVSTALRSAKGSTRPAEFETGGPA